MQLEFEPVKLPAEAVEAIEFLVGNEWPFHGISRLTRTQAADVDLVGHETTSFWVRSEQRIIGLVRAFDLGDVDVGSPLIDIRIAEPERGRGVGRAAVTWLTDHLFTTYPALHRIEATTRHDNLAMQSVFAKCGYRLEGRHIEAWGQADGTRFDSLVYAILRREWRGSA